MDRALASILASSFVTPFIASALGVTLPALASSFGVPSTATVSLLVALTLAVAVFVLPFGRLADVAGYGRMFRAGLAVAGAGLASAALSPGLEALYGSLLVAGMGLAAVFGSNNALLFHIVPPERRATAVGLNSASVYLGLLAGPAVGGLLAQFSWRLIFAPAAFLILLSYALVGRVAAAGRAAGGFDVAGSVVLGGSIALVVLGVDAGLWTAAALGAAGLAAAFLLESRREAPVLEVGLFRSVVFSASVAAAFLNYLSTAALSPSLSLLFQEVYKMAPRDAGFMLSLQALAMALLAPVAGRVSDRVSPSAVAALGAGVLAAALYLLSAEPSPTAAPWLLLALGAGFAFFIVPNTTIILSSVPPSRRGTASALVAEARVLGQSLSNAVASYVLRSAPGVAAGVSALTALLAYISVATVFLSLVRHLSH
ncbi:MFS transporter [Pyrobaculum sp.]|uniref:MFS transporter n=1 Tax=Pyrobaculum sp. TaxID=2004705 RepID=UPI003D0BE5AB